MFDRHEVTFFFHFLSVLIKKLWVYIFLSRNYIILGLKQTKTLFAIFSQLYLINFIN